jgi:hypothetical protein
MSRQIDCCPICGAPFMERIKHGRDGDMVHMHDPSCDCECEKPGSMERNKKIPKSFWGKYRELRNLRYYLRWYERSRFNNYFSGLQYDWRKERIKKLEAEYEEIMKRKNK